LVRFDKGDDPTMVHSASGASSSNGPPVPFAQRSKLA
jgi:hypothetical protein